MRVLIPLHQITTWAGGMDLCRTIVDVLKSAAQRHPLELVFALSAQRDTKTPVSAELARLTDEMTQGARVMHCSGDGRELMRAAVDADAQIIFPTMTPIRGSHVRKIGYIYDFQHLDLPELFTIEECDRRSQTFLDLIEKSDAMFCTSEFVATGITLGLGVPKERVLVLPFLPHADAAWFDTDIGAAQARHGVGSSYLIVCNHFWVHKDHATVLHAFAQVRSSGAHDGLRLVMTGDTRDFRDPNHFGKLEAAMRELGIAEHCHVLGLIPKPEQIALLRGALAMVQPTRYEGSPGGMSTFQAAGLGVPALLSDIDVNREAQGAGIRHFRFGDADNLARQIRDLLAQPPPRPDRSQLETDAQSRRVVAGDAMFRFLQALNPR
jgi:glycosyltransferase involved in cell wall biosynthesis